MTKYRIDSHGQADHCGTSYYLVKEVDDEITAHYDAIRREACIALDEAIADLERGFVSCDRCGYEEPSTTLDAYWMLKACRAAILGAEPAREES